MAGDWIEQSLFQQLQSTVLYRGRVMIKVSVCVSFLFHYCMFHAYWSECIIFIFCRDNQLQAIYYKSVFTMLTYLVYELFFFCVHQIFMCICESFHTNINFGVLPLHFYSSVFFKKIITVKRYNLLYSTFKNQ